ncbi:MAG: hypothetical protein ACLTG4_08615 [Oscillospiraceae bacterium]
MNILHEEQANQVIASLGGQTAINLAQPLMTRGVQIIGTDCAAIERAENRDCFEKLLLELNIPQPMGAAVTNLDDGLKAAHAVGYPVLVRPSFVLGGRAAGDRGRRRDAAPLSAECRAHRRGQARAGR